MPARRSTGTSAGATVHDASIVVWSALLAAGARRPALAAMAVNLVSGTPLALARFRERRRDVVALGAPPLVGLAVLTTVRGATRPALVTTAVLIALRATEVLRARRSAQGGSCADAVAPATASAHGVSRPGPAPSAGRRRRAPSW